MGVVWDFVNLEDIPEYLVVMNNDHFKMKIIQSIKYLHWMPAKGEHSAQHLKIIRYTLKIFMDENIPQERNRLQNTIHSIGVMVAQGNPDVT